MSWEVFRVRCPIQTTLYIHMVCGFNDYETGINGLLFFFDWQIYSIFISSFIHNIILEVHAISFRKRKSLFQLRLNNALLMLLFIFSIAEAINQIIIYHAIWTGTRWPHSLFLLPKTWIKSWIKRSIDPAVLIWKKTYNAFQKVISKIISYSPHLSAILPN